jgi:hypothetical protein
MTLKVAASKLFNLSVVHLFLIGCTVMVFALKCHSAPEKPCAKNIHELNLAWGHSPFPLKWRETSMSDGKPLMVSIQERNGGFFIQFVKEKEGLWAESTGVICQAGSELEIEFNGDQLRLGPAANWLIRMAIGGGGKFSLSRVEGDQLRIQTRGWQGFFSSK